MISDSLYLSVHEFKAGDKSAFQNVYLLSYQLVFCRAMKIMKNEQDSYDIVQSVYIKLYSKIYQLSDEKKFVSWILTMTDNECRNMLRSQKRSIQFSVMDDEEIDVINNIADECPNPVQIADSNELNVQIKSFLDGLPPEQQKVMVMYYYEQMGVEEIALSLGCSAGTVKSRLNYGRKNMKKFIEKYEKCNSVKLYSSVFMWIVSDIKNFFAALTVKTAAVATAAAVLTTQAVVTTVKRTDSNYKSSIEYITEAPETYTELSAAQEIIAEITQAPDEQVLDQSAESTQTQPVPTDTPVQTQAKISKNSAAVTSAVTSYETQQTTVNAATSVQTEIPDDADITSQISGKDHRQPEKHDVPAFDKDNTDGFPGMNKEEKPDFDHFSPGFGNVMWGHHQESTDERKDETMPEPSDEEKQENRFDEHQFNNNEEFNDEQHDYPDNESVYEHQDK
ncbi:MAG: sigma-70 family RNA polymerase sigma factor [Oscillospiraceae bacterium]|nr:sigma-70 family RNA polymerase sigma factor [Oscillospiraceae bacterium]